MLILVVDDNREWGACIARALKQECGEEFEVLTAESGLDAIRVVGENPTKRLRGVITNFYMGSGMNGAQLAERIVEEAPEPKPVIILRTTQIRPGVVSECFNMIRQKSLEVSEVKEFAASAIAMFRRRP